MKKIASLFLMLMVLCSCSEDLSKNSPSLQGLKDDVLWRAKSSQATINTAGNITITGLTAYETLTLKTQGTNAGIYVLGLNSVNQASYVYAKDGQELYYTTSQNVGDGQIVIEEYDPVKMTISGTFRFNAENVDENPLGGPVLNYQQGVFYKLPVFPAL